MTTPTQDSTAAGFDVEGEFDRQVAALATAGHARPGLFEPLRGEVVARCAEGRSSESAGLPFVLVVPGVRAADSMPHVEVHGLPGFVSADGTDLDTYGEIPEVALPNGAAYVLLDVRRGDEYADWSPDEALPAILAAGRTPLTVGEGIALLTVTPAILEKNRCFMLLASRGTDKRVPALWISGGTGKDGRARRNAPKLGWCWAGNRHPWLGHASAGGRLGSTS